jgi:signal transduction histidine kinase
MLGGTLDVQSAPGGAITRIEAKVPLEGLDDG